MQTRFVALDMWRSALLLFGLLVHAAVLVRTLPGDTSGFSWIEEASRSARMQGFFAIAGFLAARSIEKRDRGAWLRRRMAQLLIPATVTWATFSRLTDWVSSGDPFANALLFGHVWFLYMLAPFSLATYLLARAPPRKRELLVARWLERASPWLVVACFLASAFAGKLAMTGIYMAFPQIARSEGGFENFHVFARAPVMLVFYLFGHVMAHCRFMERLRLAPMAIAFLFSVSAYIWLQEPNGYDVVDLPGIPRKVAMLVMYLMLSAAGTFLALTVFAHAAIAKRLPRIFVHLSRASYTIYLVHLFYLTALFRLLSPRVADRPVLLCCLVVLGMLLSLITHEVFARSRTLRFLFNGQAPPGSAPSPMVATTS